MNNTLTAERERTGTEKALGLLNGNGGTQSLDATETVYCQVHGCVKAVWGQCIECFDEGYRDFDATRVAKELIPEWTGINVNGRQVIVTRVRDALDAVQAISRYKNADALILIVWDRLITALDRGRIGPSWVMNGAVDADAAEEIECARCCQPFRPTMGDETICDECYLHEHGPPHR